MRLPTSASAAGVELVESPAPQACPACEAPLERWGFAEPQEPSLRRRYLLWRCAGCGTASTAGDPELELYETGVYSEATTRLEGLIEAIRRAGERQKLALLRRALPPPARIAELGAGQGRFIAAAQDAGYQVSGFEPSQRGVEIAAKRGIALTRTTLEGAEMEPGSVEGVVLWHVLEHLEQPDLAIRRLREWLPEDGAALIGVPNLASLQAAIAGPRWLHLDVPRHRHHFTPAGVTTLLEREGFRVERIHHVLLEHNQFGMLQAWLDRVTVTPSYAYNLIKRNASVNARDLLPTLAVGALAPLAFMLELFAGLAGRGGTVAVLARRR